ncbi:MAG: hypothetical protein EVA89_30170 [Sandaracinaceae bacterium]|nr:MAG: hypothetical protein EVA89_30170 [Sandaracinaceae bacterium]
MKTWIVRALVVIGLLFFGWIGHFFLAPRGLAWIVWTVASVIGAFVALEVILRTRKRREERADWARFEAAVTDPGSRREVIRELVREIDRARRFGPRGRMPHARLAVRLAELHLANDDAEKALQALAKVPVTELEPLPAAVVRCARAQAYLHAGDADGAHAALSPLGAELDAAAIGDPVLDATLALARGGLALERGDPDAALQAARSVTALAEPHDELWDEARALEAAALDAQGASDEAAETLGSIRATGRARLEAIGTARVRRLLAA